MEPGSLWASTSAVVAALAAVSLMMGSHDMVAWAEAEHNTTVTGRASDIWPDEERRVVPGGLTPVEEQFEDHGNGDRLPEAGAGHEAPLASRLDRLGIEPKDVVQ